MPRGDEPSAGAAESKLSETPPLPGGLYLVATPIGNAADITLRAMETLSTVDAIACEDTRVTAKLLAIHGLSKPLIVYHEHNAEKLRPRLIQRLQKGESVALVSDAGTPLVSDPGYKLVRACRDNAIPVTALPGPSAVLGALVLSGLPTNRFLFAGFLPTKTGPRQKALSELAWIPATLVIMESPRRLAAALRDMAEILGAGREAAVTRELTKMFEEVRQAPLADLAAHYAEAGAPKGEVTLVIAPPGEKPAPDPADIDRMLVEALGRNSVRDAAAQVAQSTGLPRRQIYNRALALKKDKT